MATYQIICVETAELHDHIVSVCTGHGSAVTAKFTIQEVMNKIDKGDVFFTSDENRNVALVHRDTCHANMTVAGREIECGIAMLRSGVGGTAANDIANMKECFVR